MRNKVEAVRVKSTSVIINIIKKSPREWCENELLPQLFKVKDESNYLLRQRVIAIIN